MLIFSFRRVFIILGQISNVWLFLPVDELLLMFPTFFTGMPIKKGRMVWVLFCFKRLVVKKKKRNDEYRWTQENKQIVHQFWIVRILFWLMIVLQPQGSLILLNFACLEILVREMEKLSGGGQGSSQFL